MLQILAAVGSVALTLSIIGGGMAWLGGRIARGLAQNMRTVAAKEMAVATGKITERIDASDEATAQQLAEIKAHAESDRLEMARQFGGNGGGMREAINSLTSQVQHLTGRFEQHLLEEGKHT